jgi:hypothetical protein
MRPTGGSSQGSPPSTSGITARPDPWNPRHARHLTDRRATHYVPRTNISLEGVALARLRFDPKWVKR